MSTAADDEHSATTHVEVGFELELELDFHSPIPLDPPARLAEAAGGGPGARRLPTPRPQGSTAPPAGPAGLGSYASVGRVGTCGRVSKVDTATFVGGRWLHDQQ